MKAGGGGLAGVVLVVLLAAVVSSGTPLAAPSVNRAAPAPSRLALGTLVSRPEHSNAEAAVGIRDAMVELSWAKLEPEPGKFDVQYIAAMRTQIGALRNTGRVLTLGLGLEDAPDWLLALPDSRFVNQRGEVSSEPDLVFDQRLRDRASDYLTRVGVEFGFGGFAFVRLNSGASSELTYPDTGDDWAFDTEARNGPGMSIGMARNPAPGWQPANGPLDEGTASAWAAWYVGALADLVRWQIGVLSGLGFRGTYQVLTPGVGLRPTEFAAALRQQPPKPVGLLGVGAVWALFYSQLPRRSDIMAYVTSTADSSGDNDLCAATDRSVPLTSDAVEEWSAARWISRIADENGFAKGGENPGWGIQPFLNASYRDRSGTGMLASAVRQARTCGFQVLYWAHDDQLWDGTASFDEFARQAQADHG